MVQIKRAEAALKKVLSLGQVASKMSLQDSLDGSHLIVAPNFSSARFQLLAIDDTLASEIEAGSECVAHEPQ